MSCGTDTSGSGGNSSQQMFTAINNGTFMSAFASVGGNSSQQMFTAVNNGSFASINVVDTDTYNTSTELDAWATGEGYITDGNTNWDNSYGYITDGNTNWDNSYGFITDGNTNWDNSYGFITEDTYNTSTELDAWASGKGYITEDTYNTSAELDGDYLRLTDQRFNETDWVVAQGYLTSYTDTYNTSTEVWAVISGGTLNSGKWCTYDGSGIDCNVEPVTDTNTYNNTEEMFRAINNGTFSTGPHTIDTTIANCSTDNSCGLITYDSELSYTTDTYNTTTELDRDYLRRTDYDGNSSQQMFTAINNGTFSTGAHTVDTTIANCTTDLSCGPITYDSELSYTIDTNETIRLGVLETKVDNNNESMKNYVDSLGDTYNTTLELDRDYLRITDYDGNSSQQMFTAINNGTFSTGSHTVDTTIGNCSGDESCNLITYDSELSYTIDTNETVRVGLLETKVDDNNLSMKDYVDSQSDTYNTTLELDRDYLRITDYDGNSSQQMFTAVNNGTFSTGSHTIDTTIANCSGEGSCSLITYDSELTYTVDTNETVRVGLLETKVDNNNASMKSYVDSLGDTYNTTSELDRDYLRWEDANTSQQMFTAVNNGTFSTGAHTIDTTIGNCSGDGSCGLITYDSELSYTIDTYNTSAELDGDYLRLTDQRFNETSWVEAQGYSTGAHTTDTYNTSAELDEDYLRITDYNGNSSQQMFTAVNNGTFSTGTHTVDTYNNTEEIFRAINNGSFSTGSHTIDTYNTSTELDGDYLRITDYSGNSSQQMFTATNNGTFSKGDHLLGSQKNELVLGLNFNNASIIGDKALDNSQFGNDANITGTTHNISDYNGGGSLDFDGLDDKILVGPNPELEFTIDDDFTVEVWFLSKETPISGTRPLVISGPGSPSPHYELYISNTASNRTTFVIGNGSTMRAVNGDTKILMNSWYHVVGRYNDSMLYIYVNGLMDDSPSAYTLNQIINDDYSVEIGFKSASTYFNGSLGEVNIYKRALSDSEIYDNYRRKSSSYDAYLSRKGGTIRGDVTLTSILDCDSLDTDSSGKLICGVDAGGSGGNSTQQIFTAVNNGTFMSAFSILGNSSQQMFTAINNGTFSTGAHTVDTTIANCSGEGSCGLITYDTELSYTIDTNETVRVGLLETKVDNNNASMKSYVDSLGDTYNTTSELDRDYLRWEDANTSQQMFTAVNNGTFSTGAHTIDTTIGNCSGDGSCGLITYDSELSYTIDTYNTSAELDGDYLRLTDQRFNETGWVTAQGYSTGAHTIDTYNTTAELDRDYLRITNYDGNSSQQMFTAINNGTFSTGEHTVDTTIGNCSGEGSCDLITYDSELSYTVDTYNTSAELDGDYLRLTDQRYNETNWVEAQGYSTGAHTTDTYNTSVELDGDYLRITDYDGNSSQQMFTAINNGTFSTGTHTIDTNETIRVGLLETKVDNNNASMKSYVDAQGDSYNTTAELDRDYLRWGDANTSQQMFTAVNNGTFSTGDHTIDTTIGNCSGESSCGLITYDSELSYTIDTNETIRVGLLETKVDNNNASMKSYVDAQEDAYNTTAELDRDYLRWEDGNTSQQMFTAVNNGTFSTGAHTTDTYNNTEEIFRAVNNGSFANSVAFTDIDSDYGAETVTSAWKFQTYNTGDVLSNEYDLEIGDTYGAIEIGEFELFQSELTIAGMNLNGTVIFRNEISPISSNVEFAWATTDNKLRFAIPKAGPELATYNPRSMMIGGSLGQAFNNSIVNCLEQGYQQIDCNTTETGADLGIQDDLEVQGKIYTNDWTNVTITESQITDLTHTTDTYNTTTELDRDYLRWEDGNTSQQMFTSANNATFMDINTDNWWNADGDISVDTISESKIAFSTACASGNHYFLNGNDLDCEADADTIYTAGDAITFDGLTIDFDGGTSPAGDLGGTWANPTVDSGIHDDEYLQISNVNGSSTEHNKINVTGNCLQIGTAYFSTNESNALIISTTPC